MSDIRLIVGLGNPGAEYEQTRHNAGFLFLDEIARQYQGNFKLEKKYAGEYCKVRINGEEVHLLKPMTYMNRSGQAVGPLANFFKISPEEILVVHDELDIPPGTAKLKKGGGHGGHNGLKDIIRCLANSKEFHRLRLGIGHPGDSKLVANYVLKKAPVTEMQAIEATIDEAARILPTFLAGDTSKAMNQLHSFKA
ncbi:aminoacyl-tRNA hydrolase [Litoribrevibacter albus]|uniref:Peptidyl-tRNA hydrolase n=1 Tax=Litoribrevibacter albus TaxID=1473156 RepID=A0AA37W731_9GAMM|nr:aminoacyl-tRNA hydrolase [Litoribrevibacter albus]GLQ32472.1 peptidyl-tRNA hydrolase [Litoribrevibacter albus]